MDRPELVESEECEMCHREILDDEKRGVVELEEPHIYHRDCLSFLVQRARAIFEHPVLRLAIGFCLIAQAYFTHESVFRPWLNP